MGHMGVSGGFIEGFSSPPKIRSACPAASQTVTSLGCRPPEQEKSGAVPGSAPGPWPNPWALSFPIPGGAPGSSEGVPSFRGELSCLVLAEGSRLRVLAAGSRGKRRDPSPRGAGGW